MSKSKEQVFFRSYDVCLFMGVYRQSSTDSCVYQYNHYNANCANYSGTSLIRSPMGLGKSDLNGEVTVLQEAKLHCGIQFGTEQG